MKTYVLYSTEWRASSSTVTWRSLWRSCRGTRRSTTAWWRSRTWSRRAKSWGCWERRSQSSKVSDYCGCDSCGLAAVCFHDLLSFLRLLFASCSASELLPLNSNLIAFKALWRRTCCLKCCALNGLSGWMLMVVNACWLLQSKVSNHFLVEVIFYL